MPPLADADARTRIRADLQTSMFVEAAAGTGKTTEIINRIVAVLADGTAHVGSIVVVTFTKKAAGELKLRLRASLEHHRQRTEHAGRRALLDDALAHLEEARISTIHSFCDDLLAERPVESRVDPAFSLLAEGEAEQLHSSAFRDWLEERLADPSEGLRRVLRRHFRSGPVSDVLRADSWALAEWRDCTRAWAPTGFDRASALDDLVAGLQALVQDLQTNVRDTFAWDLRGAIALDAYIRQTEAVRARDVDELEGRFIALLDDYNFKKPKRGSGQRFSRSLTRTEVVHQHRRFVTALEAFRDAANADLAPHLHRELLASLDRYDAVKAKLGVLDFNDLLLRARDLVRDDATVRAELQGRFSHLFIDEFQDTSALQAEFLLLLAADDPATASWRDVRPAPGKLFLVGDPKQSIYGFRRADIQTYQAVKAQLEAAGVACLELTTSFRAVPEIQHFVNAAFAPEMTGTLQPLYVPLTPWRAEEPSQPAVVALPIPKPYGLTDVIAKSAMRASLPDAVGAFVAWLVHESGWTVLEGTERRPIAPRHVCILFKQFKQMDDDLTRPYVSALEARDLPHIVVGGRSLHAREEVETLRAALAAIEYPDDELSLYATLRGALFAFTDADLLEYRRAHGLDFTRLPDDTAEHLRPILAVLETLRALHRLRNARPVADTLMRLIEYTRSFANFVFRPSGEQVLANVLLIEELARAYDASDALSFRRFVQLLEVYAERNQAAEAPTLEEGSDGVRMMTAFKAKGLEFPVVILADPCPNRRGDHASRYVDAERGLFARALGGCAPRELLDNTAAALDAEEAEVVRLAYVATTRAQDLLVVPVLGEHPYTEGWLDPLNRAIYPVGAAVRAEEQPLYAATFGPESTLSRPAQLQVQSVTPGSYRFGAGNDAYSVVWWDPAQLDLDREPRFGIRQETLLAKDAPPILVAEDVRSFTTWATAREALVAEASRSTLRVATVTDRARSAAADLQSVASVDVPRSDETRPTGARFGTLVHSILATTPLEADLRAIQSIAMLCGRILSASDDEVAAAATAVGAALAHPLLRRASAAERRGACRRETPITLTDDAGTIVEGVIDLAFEEEGAWVVVDFKTDIDMSRHQTAYEQQVGIYVQAVARSTGARVRGVLLRI
jgi:ATP-dependent helicase/nuclease subunit A